jgi:hypothetical protein
MHEQARDDGGCGQAAPLPARVFETLPSLSQQLLRETAVLGGTRLEVGREQEQRVGWGVHRMTLSMMLVDTLSQSVVQSVASMGSVVNESSPG